MELMISRDREGRFEPQIVANNQREFLGFDDKILALYARGITPRDIESEGSKFWTQVLSELRQPGLKDIIFLCADGLKGLPEAVEASFPAAVFQPSIVHGLRSSVRYVSWKDRKTVCEG